MKSLIKLIFTLVILSFSVVIFKTFWSPQRANISVVTTATPLTVASATASNTKSGSSPQNAIDHDLNTTWESGTTAPQWIMLDLGRSYTINQLRLQVAQSPAGRTNHRIEAGSSPDSLTHLLTVDKLTSKAEPINIPLLHPVPNVRYLKITTTQSPSWVAWKEIEVFAGDTKVVTNLKYFGYLSNDYNYQTPTYFQELNNLGNTNIAWGTNHLADFNSNHLQVLYPPESFWMRPKTGPDSGKLRLIPTWSTLWAAERAKKIDPYLDSIYGFYMDEPYWNGITKDEFAIFTQALRDAYPTKKIFIIEAAPPIRNQEIPLDYYKNVTDIGFDYYFTLESATNDIGWAEYLSLTDKFRPYMSGKNYWLVPDGYGPSSYSSRWSDAYERYLGLALTEPQAVGMLGFIYNLPSELRAGNVSLYHLLNPGQTLYDPGFRARQIEIGRSLISTSSTVVSTSPSAPASTPTPSSVALQIASSTASLTRSSSSPQNAVDHNLATSWESGSTAPQWIMLDLGSPKTITKLKFNVAQSPAGRTVHKLEVGSTPTSLTTLTTLDGVTSRDNPIDYVLARPVTTRYLRITTTLSPSWIAWKDIDVFGYNP